MSESGFGDGGHLRNQATDGLHLDWHDMLPLHDDSFPVAAVRD